MVITCGLRQKQLCLIALGLKDRMLRLFDDGATRCGDPIEAKHFFRGNVISQVSFVMSMFRAMGINIYFLSATFVGFRI